MNVPTKLTLLRVVLVPILLLLLLVKIPYGPFLAVAVFAFGAITDGVDGYLARRRREVTRLGKFLDPLADKLLVTAALLALVELGSISSWVALIIIGREMAVTGLRAIAAAEQVVIAAGKWGKWKTGFQIAAIIAAITAQGIPHVFFTTVADLLMAIAVVLTVYSGLLYLMGSWHLLLPGRRTSS